ncbi:MAG: hypothetical protein HY905_23500 [Deltaproteobacteria bacterium]|nr:hypothetical protein [Deltaproteobacteria bacterium]
MSRTDGRKKPQDVNARPSSPPPLPRGTPAKGRPPKGSLLDGVLNDFLKQKSADAQTPGDAPDSPTPPPPEIAALFQELDATAAPDAQAPAFPVVPPSVPPPPEFQVVLPSVPPPPEPHGDLVSEPPMPVTGDLDGEWTIGGRPDPAPAYRPPAVIDADDEDTMEQVLPPPSPAAPPADEEAPVLSPEELGATAVDESAAPAFDESAAPTLDESAAPALDESAAPALDESAAPAFDDALASALPEPDAAAGELDAPDSGILLDEPADVVSAAEIATTIPPPRELATEAAEPSSPSLPPSTPAPEEEEPATPAAARPPAATPEAHPARRTPPAERPAAAPQPARASLAPGEPRTPMNDHQAYRREAQKLARVRDWKKFAELTAAVVESASWASLPETRAALLGDLARIYRDRLKDSPAAENAYKLLAQADPANADAMEFLSASYRDREDWRALHALYGAAVEAAWDPDQRLDWTREAATLADERLRSVDLAIAAWERLYRLGEPAEETVQALQDVYRRARRWDRLADFLRERAAQRAGADRLVALREVAEAYLCGLRDHDQAAAVLEQILADRPDDIIALLGMGRVLARRKQWPALAALGARPLEGAQTGAILDFRRLVADALWTAGEHESSVAIHDRILAIDPEDPDALKAKEAYYTESEKVEALVQFLAARADAVEDPARRAEYLARAARLAEERLEDPRLAVSLWQRRSQLEADRLETHRALAALHEKLGEPEGVARALEGQLALTRRPASRIELLRRLGAHYAHRLADDAKAEVCWKEILSFVPDDAETRDELIALLRRRGDFEALDRILSAQAGLSTDPAAALGFWRAAAVNIEEHVYDPARAVRAWWRVLDLTPDDADILHGFVGHCRNVGRARELLAAQEAELRIVREPAARVRLALDLAASWEKEGRPAAALACYERVLRWSPADPAALDAVARLRGPAEAGAAIGALDVAAASLDPTAAPERIALLRRSLDLLDPADRIGRFFVLRRILWLSGCDAASLADLSRAAEDAGAWRDLVAVHLELAARATDDATRAALERDLARLYEQREKDPVRAFLVLQNAGAQAPRDPELLEELARLAEATGRHEDLLALLDVAARVGSGPQRRTALRRRAAVCESKLGDAERAFHEWVRVLALDSHDSEALENARRLAAAKGLWRQLDALYAELWDRAADVAERIALARARHQVHAEQLEDPMGALDWLLVVYRLDPAAPGVWDQIAAAAEALQAWGRVLPVLEARVRAEGQAASPDELARCAELWEQRRGDREQALDLYADAFVLRPSATELRGHLERLAEAAGRLDLLALHYRLAAARSPDADQKRDFYGRLTAIYAQALDRPGETLDIHRRILQLQPSALPSLEVVLDHHRTAKNWRELRDSLQQWLTHAPAEPAARIPRLLEIARLSREELADPEMALTSYAQVLDLDPANDEAAQGVRSLTAGHIEPSLELRRLRLELVRATGDRRAEILLSCARIHEEQLDDVPAAVAALRELLTETGAAGPAFAPLERLLRAGGAWAELINLLEARAGAVPDAAARLESLPQAIAVCEDHPDAAPPERRERLYRRVIEERPDDAEVRRRLLSVFRESARYDDLLDFLRSTRETLPHDDDGEAERRAIDDEIIRVLDRGLGRSEEAEKLLSERSKKDADDADALLGLASLKLRRGDFVGWFLLRQQHARKLPPAQGALAMCHLAEASDETAGQQARSAGCYREARTLDGNCTPAIKALQAIGRRAKNWRATAALLPEDGEAKLPWPERAARLTALGTAARDDHAAALGWLQRAVAVDPDHVPAWDALARLHAERGDHAAALDAERETLAAFERTTVPEPGRLREHAERIQRMATALERTGNPDEANRMSLRAFRLVPAFAPAALAVAEKRLEAGQDDAAFSIYDRVLREREHPLPDGDRLQATFRRGALLARLGKSEQAVADLREGLRIDSLHSGLLNALADVLAGQGRVAAAVQHYIQALLVAHEAARRGALYARLGRLWDDRLSSPDEAGACFDLAIAAGADDHDLMVRALRHYRRLGLSERALSVIERLLPTTTDAKELAGLWTERGGALSAADEDKAMEAYDMALSYDPGSQAALSGLAAILERRGDWDQLLQIYEARADSGTPAERAHALRNLASIAVARLGDKTRAERYLRTALELAPVQTDFEQVLELIGQDPARLADRQSVLAGLLRTTGPRLPRIVDLAKTLVAADRRRQAWCIVSPLAHVGSLEGHLRSLLMDLRKEFEKAENLGGLSPQTHYQVRHPDVDPALLDVLTQLDEAVPLGPATPQEAGAAGAGHMVARTPIGKSFAALAEKLGIADAALLRAADLPVPVRPLDVPEAHVLIKSELFQLLQPAETNFLLALALELARPGARLVASLDPDDLRHVVAALFAATGLAPETPPSAPYVAKLREGAAGMLGAWADMLRDLAPAFTAGNPLADKLRHGVLETSRRVGLVAAGELRFVARMMTRLDPNLPKLQMSGKMNELEEFLDAAPDVTSLLAWACTPEFGKVLG